MVDEDSGQLSKWKRRIVWALIGVWVLSKGYRLRLLQEYGLFSWAFWRVDLALAGSLVLVGIVAFRVASRYENARPETRA